MGEAGRIGEGSGRERGGGEGEEGGEGGMEYSIENHMCSCRMEGPPRVIWEGW